ncbi:tail fiber domain-containing protein [Candidatus Wolfebacteria bacterium]|nr:tail fiber domain-containing protein [Candidatus Wolfebacteria bacterium]
MKNYFLKIIFASGISIILIFSLTRLVWGWNSPNNNPPSSTNQAMYINSSGNVGIGTTNPTGGRLHVDSGSSAGVYSIGTGSNFVADTNTTGVFGHLRGQRQGVLKYYLGLDASDNFAILSTAAAPLVSVTNSGNVGIGTTSPNSKLEVSADNPGIRLSDTTALATPSMIETIGDVANTALTISNNATAASGTWNRIDTSYGAANIHMMNDGRLWYWTAAAGANPITWVDRLYMDTSGNVGIGTTSPTGKLTIKSGTNADLEFGSSGTTATYLQAYNRTSNVYSDMNFYTTPAITMAIKADSGNVGIGTTSPTAGKLQVAGSVTATGAQAADLASATTLDYSNGGRFIVNGPDTSTNGTLNFYLTRSNGSNTLNPLTLKNDGNVGIGTTSPGSKLTVGNNSGSSDTTMFVSNSNYRAIYGYGTTVGVEGAGIVGGGYSGGTISGSAGIAGYGNNGVYGAGATYGVFGYSGNSGGWGIYCGGTGTLYCGGGAAWSNVSDIRLKKDILTINSALEKVLKLRGVNYIWKDDITETNHVGFIAQEVLPIVPEVVGKNKDGYYVLSYAEFAPLFTEAIKEQQLQIEELKAEVKELKAGR